jgi:transposase-like protein
MLGPKIANKEGELFGSGLFQDLADQGLSRAKLMASEGHEGIQKAVEKPFRLEDI